MAIVLLIAGSFFGVVAAVLQWTLQDASLMQGIATYFAFGFGFPVAVGLTKWIELRIRAAFETPRVMGPHQVKS